MQNTRLGISAGLLGAILFVAGLIGNYVILLIAACYVLLMEENVWLKRAAIKAVVVSVIFTIINAIVGLIPDLFEVIGDLMALFDETLTGEFFDFINKFVALVYSVLNLAEIALFLMLIFKALKNATVIIPPIDNFINKHIN